MMGQARSTAGEGVPTSRIGERVWLYETQRQRGFGTAAGFAVVPSDHAVYLPENTNFAEAACWGSRDDSSPLRLCRRFCAGTNYFSDGWSGAVGYYALQLAKWVEQRRSQP